jgi:hypothetical protein
MENSTVPQHRCLHRHAHLVFMNYLRKNNQELGA